MAVQAITQKNPTGPGLHRVFGVFAGLLHLLEGVLIEEVAVVSVHDLTGA
jgi:hypothetical protein